jgi:glycosyltransferase involved in cell wall biosynthesis
MRRLTDRPVDVLIDLTEGSDCTRRPRKERAWPHPDSFTLRARRVTCVVHPDSWALIAKLAAPLGWTVSSSSSAIAACTDAMCRTAADRALLLVLHGEVEASNEAVFAMRQALERDAMFGCAAARIRCSNGCCLRRPSQGGLKTGAWIPRRTLADIPDTEICADLFESGLLLAPDVLAEFGPLDTRFSSLPGGILHYLSRARRCGFRMVLANRAVMSLSGLRCDAPQPDATLVPEPDQDLLVGLTPEVDKVWGEFRSAANERFEHLSAHVHSAIATGGRRSLLIDIRNVVAIHNGTSHAVLGCVDALHRLSPSWDITVLASPSAIPFHRLAKAWPGWSLTTTLPIRPFAVALRLSQPWHIQEMVDLHHAALFNVYFVLDTISWDVVYAAPARLDGTWNFLADHADGLLFDSAFTERMFLSRFGQAESVRRAVCYYPFDPADYLDPKAKPAVASDGILVIGNNLDHKDASKTVELLASAFPFRPLTSLGPKVSASPHVRVFQSGSLSNSDVHRLYAEAKYIVFPSFYEGFGFPTVTALAYGKTLIARKSELLDEIAARCSTGRLIAFTRRDQLVDILGRLFQGEDVQQEPLGTAVSDVSRRWPDVARDLMTFVDDVSSMPAHSGWRRREHAVNQLLAFRA